MMEKPGDNPIQDLIPVGLAEIRAVLLSDQRLLQALGE